MISVVIKGFRAYGEDYVPGDLVDSGSFRNEANLVSTRYLRPATPEEYSAAMGLTSSFDQEVPESASRGRKGKAKVNSADDTNPVPDEELPQDPDAVGDEAPDADAEEDEEVPAGEQSQAAMDDSHVTGEANPQTKVPNKSLADPKKAKAAAKAAAKPATKTKGKGK